jgi:hypothetical protein
MVTLTSWYSGYINLKGRDRALSPYMRKLWVWLIPPSSAVVLNMRIQMNGCGRILWAWLIWPCKYEIASYGPEF